MFRRSRSFLTIVLGCILIPMETYLIYNTKLAPSNVYPYKSSPPSSSLWATTDGGFASIAEYSKLGKKLSDVLIEAPSMNSRRITANIIIDSPMDVVWSIITDYNNLATHVPNLVKSYLVPSPPSAQSNTLRLFQEGAQKIIGFDFRASLTMDMSEEKDDDRRALKEWRVRFKLIESRMFDAFDGIWSLKYHSRSGEYDAVRQVHYYRYKTKLTYSVFVKPKGPVPVMALEWRIKEDVPVNLYAVKVASEKRLLSFNNNNSNNNNNNEDDRKDRSQGSLNDRGQGWALDETLESYIIDRSKLPNTAANTILAAATVAAAITRNSSSGNSNNLFGSSNSRKSSGFLLW